MIRSTLAIPFALILASAGVAQASTDLDESATAAVDGHVRVSNTSGDITVTGWDKLEVQVRGKLGDGSELQFEPEGEHTLVKVVKKDGAGNMDSSTLVVHVPRRSELTVNGVSSDIEVRNVHGVQRLEAVSGEISADVFAGDIEAKTVSGDVRIQGHGEPSLVTITALSGDCELLDIAGELESSTVSGDMDIRAGEFTRVRLSATNGDIDIVAGLAAGGRFESETISGDVDFQLAEGSNLDVEVETFNGDIKNCFDIESERKSEYGPGRLLRFSQGDGDRRVRVKTMNGDVAICDT
jgi:DUF4097 and DUF4098 domain-containing protein YvlB